MASKRLRPQTLHAAGFDFAYVAQGTGAPVLFVHGSLLDHRYWHREVAHLSDRYRAIAFSRRHHWPHTPKGAFSFRALDQAEDLIAFITALDAGPVHLVGHSYGGYLAAQVAVQRPDLLTSMVLMEPGGPVEGQDPGRSRVADHQLGADLVAEGKPAQGVAHFLDTVCFEPKWREGDAAYRAMTLDNAVTLTQQVQETRPTLPAAGLRALRCPVLLMIGARSISPFPETLERFCALIPQAQHVQIGQASHMINRDNAPAFLAALDGFLDAV